MALCPLAALLALVAAPGALAAPSLNAAVEYGAGSQPQAVALGDFNGDGKPDIAVADGGSESVSVLVNNGDGTFQTAHSYHVGGTPTGLAVGDFYGNGKLDIAVVNGTEDVTILPGEGDGSFGPPATITVGMGTSLTSIVTGEFNGHPDLAVMESSEERVYLLLNDGSGTFQAPTHLDVPGPPLAMAVGDLDGDGSQDLVVSSGFGGYSAVAVFMGKGDGTFEAPRSYPTGATPTGVVIADLDPDAGAYQDVATADSGEGRVSVLLNNGNGELQAPHSYPSGEGTQAIVAGAFGGDPHTDLAVSNSSADTVSVLEGAGDGSFATPVPLSAGEAPMGLAAGSLDGHGSDLVSADSGGEGVSVLLSTFRQLSPAPSELELAPTRVGETGAARSVTFTNTGNAPISITGTWHSGEQVVEAGNTCSGATLLPGAACKVQLAIDATEASEEIDGELVVEYAGGRGTAIFYGTAELGPGHSTVSASNKPEPCPESYFECDLLVLAAAKGWLSEEELVNEGIKISVECHANRSNVCETTILLYGSTDVWELLGGRAASAKQPTARHGRRVRRRVRVLLGSVHVKLRSGESKTLRLHLSAEARRRLGHLSREAPLELVEQNRTAEGKTVTVTRKLKVLPRKPRSSRRR